MSTSKIIITLFLLLIHLNCHAADKAIIAVSANMARTISHIQTLFTEKTGYKIDISLGASGSLTHQIAHGAPFSVFLSADPDYIRRLIEQKITDQPSVHYATGRICLYIPENSRLKQYNSIESLINQLSHGHFSRFAIANPAHAPYGRAAKMALQTAGLWALDSGKFVIGENVAQTYQFCKNNSVDLGIVAWSHHLTNKNKSECFLIPEHWHKTIEQHMVLLDNHNKVARQFLDFMQSSQVREILKQHGYGLP